MKRPFFASTSVPSMFGGRRVTYFDATGCPLVSLWGEQGAPVHAEATRLLDATPEPIDAILQAIAWHGKAAVA